MKISRPNALPLNGFTLLEMAMVIGIIALLIGGVLYGRTLVIASRLQTVLTDAENYTTAVGNFRSTYQSLPGDMATATAGWGTDTSGCPTGGGPSGTCNGNGDGEVAGVSSYEYESFRFWQQLSLAGLITPKVTGVAASGGVYDSTLGGNVPSGSVEGSGFSAIWWGNISVDTDRFPGFYGNILHFGGRVSGNITRAPILTPDQAASLDAKTDDGLPAYGKIRAYLSSSSINPNCTTTAVAATAAYNVSNTAKLCALVFVMGF